jgi:hypothetical protein
MDCLRLLASLHVLAPSAVESSAEGHPLPLGASPQAAPGAHLWCLPVESKTCSHKYRVRHVQVVLRACHHEVVHLFQVQVHLVVGKVLCWGCCRKLSRVEDGTEVRAVAVAHRGSHGVAAVEDNRASVAVLDAAGKEVVRCSLDGCVVADHGRHSRIPGWGPGGSHRRDRVDTFPILFLTWYILCVGLFPCSQSEKLCDSCRLSSQCGRGYPCFEVERLS